MVRRFVKQIGRLPLALINKLIGPKRTYVDFVKVHITCKAIDFFHAGQIHRPMFLSCENAQ